jgi:hypothetical protein
MIGAGGVELSAEDRERRLRDAIMEAGAPVVSESPGD